MLSRTSYFICLLLILYASFSFYPKWQQSREEATISYDVSGYYWYLPSFFIYHDVKHQGFIDSVIQRYHPTSAYQQIYFDSASGNYIMRYTSGMALMYLPFFTAAHLMAGALGYPADGFSAPYQLAMQLGGVLVALTGLWFFRKFLKLYYKDATVAIVLLLLVFGTNYLNYGAIDTGMSHSWLFTLYVFLLLSTHYYYQSPKIKYAIAIGVLIGLATLARPTECIAVLIPLLWGMDNVSFPALKERLSFFKAHGLQLVVAAICGAAIIFIQLLYWKCVSGHWLVYTYQDQGFSWLHPHIFSYAFSFRSGWLLYTPMMILAFIGIVPFLVKGRNKVAVIAFILLNCYIISAWDAWEYGGRAMIQSYPVLMIPMAALMDEMTRKRIMQGVLVPFLALFGYMNIWFVYAAHRDQIYNPVMMTKPYYMAVAGRFKVPEETQKLLDTDDRLFTGIPRNKKLLYENDFENDTTSHCTLPPITGKRSLCLNKDHKYSENYFFPYGPGRSGWMRAEASFRRPDAEWNVWDMAQFNVKYFNKGNQVMIQMIRVDRFMHNVDTRRLYIDVRPPRQQFDSVCVLFYNGEANKTLEVDDLKVWSFDE